MNLPNDCEINTIFTHFNLASSQRMESVDDLHWQLDKRRVFLLVLLVSFWDASVE